MKRNLGLEPLEYALHERQIQLIIEEPTNESSSNDVKIPIIISHNNHLTTVLQGITNPSQLNFQDYLSPGGGKSSNPLDSPPSTPNNPFEGESSKEEPSCDNPGILRNMDGVNANQPNNPSTNQPCLSQDVVAVP
jgi:hypothetical protein